MGIARDLITSLFTGREWLAYSFRNDLCDHLPIPNTLPYTIHSFFEVP
jgi:hypothetical protein